MVVFLLVSIQNHPKAGSPKDRQTHAISISEAFRKMGSGPSGPADRFPRAGCDSWTCWFSGNGGFASGCDCLISLFRLGFPGLKSHTHLDLGMMAQTAPPLQEMVGSHTLPRNKCCPAKCSQTKMTLVAMERKLFQGTYSLKPRSEHVSCCLPAIPLAF